MDLTFQNILNILAQTLFEGSMTVAVLMIMLAVFFVMLVILANVKAPVAYSLVPMIILAVAFSAYGALDTTLAFLIIILSVVLIATQARKLVGD